MNILQLVSGYRHCLNEKSPGCEIYKESTGYGNRYTVPCRRTDRPVILQQDILSEINGGQPVITADAAFLDPT